MLFSRLAPIAISGRCDEDTTTRSVEAEIDVLVLSHVLARLGVSYIAV